MPSANTNCWFTLGTFYMTYKDCMSSGDPAASARASFAMLYLSMLVSSMCLKYSFDSWQKYKRRYASDDQVMCRWAEEAPTTAGL